MPSRRADAASVSAISPFSDQSYIALRKYRASMVNQGQNIALS
jgi:hypothetical protein